MGQVWEHIERHQAVTPYGASVRAIARAAGVNHTTLTGWQNLKSMPQPDALRAVSRQINVPYRVLLEAALVDAGYLEQEQERNDGTATTRAGGSPARKKVKAGLMSDGKHSGDAVVRGRDDTKDTQRGSRRARTDGV